MLVAKAADSSRIGTGRISVYPVVLAGAMKRVIALGLLLNAAMLAGTPCAAGGAPLGNGDVNGSGDIDISDAVHRLRWLKECD